MNLAFAILVLVTIVAAFMVVTHRNIVHAAIYLGLCFFGMAGFYLLLDAPFVAGAQVLIYVGAITVLILFAVMMTAQRIMREPRNAAWYRLFAGSVSLVLFAVLVWVASRNVWAQDDALLRQAAEPAARAAYGGTGYLDQLAQSLLGAYLLPFEVASVLLLAALVGAIVLAKEERES